MFRLRKARRAHWEDVVIERTAIPMTDLPWENFFSGYPVSFIVKSCAALRRVRGRPPKE